MFTYIFVNDNGEVKYFSLIKFSKEYFKEKIKKIECINSIKLR